MLGCGDGGAGTGSGKQAATLANGEAATREPATTVTLGPLRFEYDSTKLSLAEVPIEIPPGYDDETWAVKLLPFARARMLGQELCRYGERRQLETCNAIDEAGLILALLERPLADYREAFQANELAPVPEPDRIEGAEGFSFTPKTGGSSIRYRFIAVDDRTLLIGHQFSGSDAKSSKALRDVIASVARQLTARAD